MKVYLIVHIVNEPDPTDCIREIRVFTGEKNRDAQFYKCDDSEYDAYLKREVVVVE